MANNEIKYDFDNGTMDMITDVRTWPVSVPTGTVSFLASSTEPNGWMECDGSAISRDTYSGLFAVIGTTFGAGDGSTTFNLPDLRGEFIRGWDNGRGADSSRVFGSYQADEFKSHNHAGTVGNYFSGDHPDGFEEGRGSPDWAVRSIGSTGGSETRPRNVALMPIIKF